MKSSTRIIAVLFVFIVLLSACGNKITTGIKGQTVLASCTGADIATSCTGREPYPATLTIYDQNMTKLKSIKSSGDGIFLVALEPGTYFIHPENTGKFPIAADFKVVVTKGKLTDLTVYYDTGLR
jgi:hypothetical protein